MKNLKMDQGFWIYGKMHENSADFLAATGSKVLAWVATESIITTEIVLLKTKITEMLWKVNAHVKKKQRWTFSK